MARQKNARQQQQATDVIIRSEVLRSRGFLLTTANIHWGQPLVCLFFLPCYRPDATPPHQLKGESQLESKDKPFALLPYALSIPNLTLDRKPSPEMTEA